MVVEGHQRAGRASDVARPELVNGLADVDYNLSAFEPDDVTDDAPKHWRDVGVCDEDDRVAQPEAHESAASALLLGIVTPPLDPFGDHVQLVVVLAGVECADEHSKQHLLMGDVEHLGLSRFSRA